MDEESNSCVIKNPMFHVPGGHQQETPMESLRHLQEMFRGQIEEDVVHLLFTESGFDFEKTLSGLLNMTNSSEEQPIVNADLDLAFPAMPSINPVIAPASTRRKSVSPKPIIHSFAELAQKQPAPRPVSVSPPPAIPPREPQPKRNGKEKKNGNNLRAEIREAIEKGEKVLVLMRGVSGSGKSYYAEQMAQRTGGKVLSSDNYFIKNGKYLFDASQLDCAHNWNQKEARKAFEAGISPIYLDNTNLEAWEMKPYAGAAYRNGYKIFLVEPETNWRYSSKECAQRNQHYVQRDKIDRMLDRFDKNVKVSDLIKETKSFSRNIPKTPDVTSPSTSLQAIVAELKCSQAPKVETNYRGKTSAASSNGGELRLVSEERIDLDMILQLELNSAKMDSDSSSSSLHPSESIGSQESAWEKDDEFIFTTTSVSNLTDVCEGAPPPSYDSEVQGTFEPNPPGETKCQSETESQLAVLPPAHSSSESVWSEKSETKVVESEHEGRRAFALVGLGSSSSINWSIPEYPKGPSKQDKSAKEEEEDRLIYVKDSSSQTENVDWALLELRQSNTDNNGEYIAIEANNDETSSSCSGSSAEDNERPYFNESSLKLDKGTAVPDFPGALTRSEIIVNLKNQFPKAQEAHLAEVLDACHGNVQWAQNLLNEFSDEHFIEIESRECSPMSDEVETAPFHNLSNGPSDEPFNLKLTPEFAAQLEREFGPVSESRGQKTDMVALSHGVARLIHHFWKKAVSDTANEFSIVDQLSLLATFGSLANDRSSSSSAADVNIPENGAVQANSRPRCEFEEIMDLELALRLSRQERDYALANTQDENLIATKLKREQLFRTYPGVPEDKLEQTFTKNNFSLTHTLAELEDKFGPCNLLSLQHRLWLARTTRSTGSPEVRTNSLVNRSTRSESPKSSPKNYQSYTEMRTEMQRLEEVKQEYLAKARCCFQSKQYAVASYYRDEARKRQDKLDVLCRAVVQSHQRSLNKSNTIDLHGFRLSEMQTVLKAFIELKQEELSRSPHRKMVLEIVTGWGSHGTAPKIRPAVVNYLDNKRMRYESANAGCIRVFLTQ